MGNHKFSVFGIILLGIFLFAFLLYGAFITGLLVGGFSLEVDPGIVVLDQLFRQGDSSTDFLRLNDTQLQSIEDMALEINDFGKVYFYVPVNLSQDAVDNKVYLDSNVVLAENYINIDSSSLSSLNRSALIFFYGLSFISPGILHNGYPCVAPECNILSYVNGELIFNVTSFSYYSAYETYSAPSGGSSSGGGSGGSSTSTDLLFEGNYTTQKVSFELDKTLFDVHFLLGESTTKYLEVINNGSSDLVLEFELSNSLKNFLKLDEIYILLLANETKRIPLHFSTGNFNESRIYVGSLDIKAGGLTKTVDILMEVGERDALFDVNLKVDKEIRLGENIGANITINNLGKGVVDVNVKYGIKSFNDEIISSGEGIFRVKDQLSLKRELSFPTSFPSGKYVFFVEVNYNGKKAVASEVFQVGENKYIRGILIVVPIFAFLVLLLILYRLWKNNRISSNLDNKNF